LDERTNDQSNNRTNERANHEQLDERSNKLSNDRTNEQTNYERLDERLNERPNDHCACVGVGVSCHEMAWDGMREPLAPLFIGKVGVRGGGED
jgi:hypothetical protein